MKRTRDEYMHPEFKNWIGKITYSDASKLKNKISVKFLLGIDPKTPLGKQAYDKKKDRPECIIMLQVANSYECFGIDAVIVVDITKSKPMNPNGEIKTSIPKSMLFECRKPPKLLANLVNGAFSTFWKNRKNEYTYVYFCTSLSSSIFIFSIFQ